MTSIAVSSAVVVSQPFPATIKLMESFPGSVEEAGALLGAAITQCGKQKYTIPFPTPDRMPSSFTIVQPIPSQQLLDRLHALRALLRTEESIRYNNQQVSTTTSSTNQQEKVSRYLTAAPSLLQVLKKLIGISTKLAAAQVQGELHSPKAASVGGSFTATTTPAAIVQRYEVPPLLSVPLRKLWVECIVICHRLGDTGKTETIQFIRQMLALVILNPRSQNASGGVRIAALDVIAALFEDDTTSSSISANRPVMLSKQLAPWSLDVLTVCLRALRSAGTGEPSYRVSAVRAACATAIACREAHLNKMSLDTSNNNNNSEGDRETRNAWLKGAMEDKAIYESVKILKQAVTDKFPEVRCTAAAFASALAPLLVLTSGLSISTNSANSMSAINEANLLCLEDVISLASKNLDDDSAYVADCWADALARCICTAIQHNQLTKSDSKNSNNESGGKSQGSDADGSNSVGRFGAVSRKYYNANGVASTHFVTLPKALAYLVDQYAKAGGELAAARLGGSFSSGGRHVRLGYCLVIVKLLQLQRDEIGDSRRISIRDTIQLLLGMVSDEVDKSLKLPTNQEAQLAPSTSTLFAAATGLTGNRTWSRSDYGLVHWATCRVLRQGLSQMSSEAMQIKLLQELIQLLPAEQNGTNTDSYRMNSIQTQVVLVEISHLFATLGEVAFMKVEDANIRLTACLSDLNHGVRHEAVTALVALASSFPAEGNKLAWNCLKEIEQHHTELKMIMTERQIGKKDVGDSSVNESADSQGNRGLGLFRRASSTVAPTSDNQSKPSDEIARPHQYAIHGKTLLLSMLLTYLPSLPGGLIKDLISSSLSTAELLVSCQFDSDLAASSTGVVVSCVRAGFCVISGVLTAGPSGVETHMPSIILIWENACKAAMEGNKNWSAKYDLHTVDAVLTSIVAFLKYSSELLLVIPECLSKLTIMLENIFYLISPTGRLGSLPPSIQLVARLESAKATIFESFAWLPSGSFPVVADSVFTMSVHHIRQAIEENVASSILSSLVTKEDSVLDAKTFCRAKEIGESGSAIDLEESIISLNSEVSLHGERESVIHLRSEDSTGMLDDGADKRHSIYESSILRHYAFDDHISVAPTPLHTIATWRRPSDPSCSSKVRLVDSAIQAFSATFGLKDGHDQDKAMTVLESLVPPHLALLAKSMGINATINEIDKRTKAMDETTTVTNIAAVLLSCLQALPLYESTHNVAIALGPPWMNKAKDLLLTLLPSSSTLVRRAAAEGLSLLATLGVTEDAHFLQSTVLHSLDDLMRGNKSEVKAKGFGVEFVSAARAGSLLTLACIQRASYKIRQRKLDRARKRTSSTDSVQNCDKSNETIPVLQMMTRILPSVTSIGFRNSFVVKMYALHSFALLLAYSNRLDNDSLSIEDKILLLKAVEIVEDNFSASWTSASAEVDRGEDVDKLAAEMAFVAVLLRLMTFLIPHLRQILNHDQDVARRFSLMAAIILENHGSYPAVNIEAMAFFEVLAQNQELVSSPSDHVIFSESPLYSCIPSILREITPPRPNAFVVVPWSPSFTTSATKSLRAATLVLKVMSKNGTSVLEWTDMKALSLLIASLEAKCGTRIFCGSNVFRSLAINRVCESIFREERALEAEIFSIVPSLLLQECKQLKNGSDILLRWILFTRQLLVGPIYIQNIDATDYSWSGVVALAAHDSYLDALSTFNVASPIRSVVKCLGAHIATISVDRLITLSCTPEGKLNDCAHFNMSEANKVCAKQLIEAAETKRKLPSSKLVFHLEEVLTAACGSCIASVDQSEVRMIQEPSALFLSKLIHCFGLLPDPDDESVSILDQFSTQIFSSIRHALTESQEVCDSLSSKLFTAGCEALFESVATKIATDPAILKRLLRPIILTDESVPFFNFEDVAPILAMQTNPSNEKSAYCVIQVAKIRTSVKILLGNQCIENREENLEKIANELLGKKENLCVHAIAVALDGIRILYGSGFSLVGIPLTLNDERRNVPCECGYYFENVSDLSDSVKDYFASSWSTSASCAVRPILKSLKDGKCEYLPWIEVLSPIFITGIHDSILALTNGPKQELYVWFSTIDPTVVIMDCLRGLSLILIDGPSSLFEGSLVSEIMNLVVLLKEHIIDPLLMATTKSLKVDNAVVTEACRFLCNVAKASSPTFRSDSRLLSSFLNPLDLLQRNSLDFHDACVTEVVRASIAGIGSIIYFGDVEDTLVRSMVNLVLTNVCHNSVVPASVSDEAKKVMRICLEQNALSSNEKNQIADDLAISRNWQLWSIVTMVQDGRYAFGSFKVLRDHLKSVTNIEDLVSILNTLLDCIQKANGSSPFPGVVFHELGPSIMEMLFLYGTNKIISVESMTSRGKLCTYAIKVVLVGYQQLASDTDASANERVTKYIVILFQSLLPVLRFNGLPNHPSPEASADPSIGRLCAQAIVHIARSSPVSFKECLTILSDVDRTLLEFSVRAEMTGYVVNQEGPKKKLNLSSFKK